MLDLIGFTTDKALHEQRLLEPSFGDGRFVLSAAERLLISWREHGGKDALELRDAIRAVELDEITFHTFKQTLERKLIGHGIDGTAAHELSEAWIVHADFLWSDFDSAFDYVIGNPPYVRQELVDPAMLARYRAEFKTMDGRADLYVPFIEKSLDLLADGGAFSFICSDAWRDCPRFC